MTNNIDDVYKVIRDETMAQIKSLHKPNDRFLGAYINRNRTRSLMRTVLAQLVKEKKLIKESVRKQSITGNRGGPGSGKGFYSYHNVVYYYYPEDAK